MSCRLGLTDLVALNSEDSPPEDQLMPFLLSDSCQSFTVNSTTKRRYTCTLSLLSTLSTALCFGWKALRSKCVPDILLHLITALCENASARIGVGLKPSPTISATSGVRRRCILAPILFCVATDWIIQHNLQPWHRRGLLNIH